MFDVNFSLLVRRLLPPRYRGVFMVSWLSALLAPLISLYETAFLPFRQAILLRLSYNGQTIVLERLLNLTFVGSYNSTGGNPIYIENSSETTPRTYIFRRIENVPNLLIYRRSETGFTPPYLFLNAEFSAGYDFIVWVSSAVAFTESNLRALVDTYRIAGKRYIVQTY